MKTKTIIYILIFLLASVSFLSGQEQAVPTGTIYVIRNIEFDVIGHSRPYMLTYHGEFKEGERITGKDNLDKYISRKTQLLINQRVLEDVRIEYTTGEEDDGTVPVDLLVHIKDSRNFIILPYPKYDSNDGLSITLKARDYNFLGTMSALRVDLGYRQDSDEKVFNFVVDSDTPFRAFGLNWVFNFDHTLSYTLGNPLYYQNVTGLSVELPWRKTTFTVGFNHYLTINEEISDENLDLYDYNNEFYDPYGSVELFTSWKIPLGIEIGDFGDVSYTPKVSGRLNYPYSNLDEPRKPVTTFSHSIGFGRTDWIGNYRKELSASLSNSYSWYFDRSDAPLQITMSAGAVFHWPFSKYLGFSSRFDYRQWWQWSSRNGDWLPYYYAGDRLRGVIDEDLRADVMLSLNLDLPIRFLRFWPSEWFKNPKLEFFNLEVFVSPFWDMALLRGPYNDLKANPFEGTKFSFSDMVSTIGLEVIVYSGYFRSLRLRGSIGYNFDKDKDTCCVVHYLKSIPRKWKVVPKWDEIYIGLDLFY